MISSMVLYMSCDMHRPFEISPETRNRFCPRDIGLSAGVPELTSESAQVIALSPIPMIEARHIHVRTTNAVVVVNLPAHQLRSETVDREANLLGEIPADHIGRVADPVWIPRRCRVEQN